jgi:hypothetical protein
VSTYTLNLIAQPGTLGRATRVLIELPEGQVLDEVSITPSSVNGRTISFDLPLKEDTVISLAMRPGETALNHTTPVPDQLILAAIP